MNLHTHVHPSDRRAYECPQCCREIQARWLEWAKRNYPCLPPAFVLRCLELGQPEPEKVNAE